MDDYIKGILSKTFENRKCKRISCEDGTYDIEVTTPNEALDEIYIYINHNTWLEYFWDCSSYLGENWMDFESEISRVIQALDAARFQVESGGSASNVEEDERKILIAILKASNGSLKNVYADINAIDKFTDFLNIELERLIRALEIYIAEFIAGIDVTKKSADIEKLNPDHVLSFNYSDT